jgi:hypothetical protein
MSNDKPIFFITAATAATLSLSVMTLVGHHEICPRTNLCAVLHEASPDAPERNPAPSKTTLSTVIQSSASASFNHPTVLVKFTPRST